MDSRPNNRSQIENVILISFDSLRSDYIDTLDKDKAPFLSMMRDKGSYFKNAIVQAPMTVPSHCSVLTGLFPASTGVRDMHHQLPEQIPSVFDLIREKGIRALSFASTPLLENGKITGVDEHLSLSPSQFKTYLYNNKNQPFLAFFHSWETHTPYRVKLPIEKPGDMVLNALGPFKALKFLPGNERFCDLLDLKIIKRIRTMMREGHPQIVEAVKKGYVKSIYQADHFLGKLYKIVEEAGLSDKTIFVIIGDHGDAFNEHNEVQQRSNDHYEHGQFLYDNALNVPLIFYAPKTVVARKFDALVQLTEITPTILDAVNATSDYHMDGISLFPAISGENSGEIREFVFSEVVRESKNLELRSIRSKKTKIIVDYKNNEHFLFDLINDPEEHINLWPEDSHQEKDKMMRALEEFKQIKTQGKSKVSDSDKQKIEKALKDLGYM